MFDRLKIVIPAARFYTRLRRTQRAELRVWWNTNSSINIAHRVIAEGNRTEVSYPNARFDTRLRRTQRADLRDFI